jgi:fatty-acyl-CoA synthase
VLDDTLCAVRPGSGEVGRLARRGHIPLGYWRDEERTARTFPTDRDGCRWVVPGDFATVDADGTVVLLGRGSQCINSAGEKIFPEEVEAALRAHPDVYDAAVVGVADERWGERCVALVQARTGAAIAADSLLEHCRTLIAPYKVPKNVFMVAEIGHTAVGKTDYVWAKAQALALAVGAR